MQITLPDGTIKQFEGPVTGFELASSIGEGLLRAAVAVDVDGCEQDLSEPIEKDAAVNILTVRSDAGLDIMRHTIAAQVLARACRELFDGCKLAIGPTIENGFYYDIEFDRALTPEDLDTIETRMRSIIGEKNDVERKMIPRDEAISILKIARTVQSTSYRNHRIPTLFPLYFQRGVSWTCVEDPSVASTE